VAPEAVSATPLRRTINDLSGIEGPTAGRDPAATDEIEDIVPTMRASQPMTVEQATASPVETTFGRGLIRPHWLILSAPLVVGLALATRLGHVDSSPHFDELYHLLAARGWLETGTFQIEGGIYDRAALYTRLVAGMLGTIGDSLELARLSSVAFGCALVLAIYLWLGTAAGWVAACVGTLLAVLWPDGIVNSQIIRFYAPHGLLFFIGAAGVYHLTSAPPTWTRSIVVGGGTVLCFALAIHLQLITFIGLVAVACWVALFVALPAILARRDRWWILAAAVALAAVAAGVVYSQGILGAVWEKFRWVPEWAAPRRDYEAFYFDLLLSEYPAFWPLLLVSIILACAVRPRLGSFCATIFLVGFVLHSVGGMKHVRYFYWLMPYWFMLVALAAAAVAGPLGRMLAGAAQHSFRSLFSPLATLRVGALMAGVAVLFVFAVNPAFRHAVALAAGGGMPQLDATDWSLARPALQPLVGDDVVLATSQEMKALYFLGRADIIVNASRLSELPEPEEFALDPRTGLPVIGTVASLQRVVECSPRGIFITPAHHWNELRLFQRATAELDVTDVERLALPDAAELVAVEWATRSIDGEACAGTDDLARRTATE